MDTNTPSSAPAPDDAAPSGPALELPSDLAARLVAFDIKTRPLSDSPDPSSALEAAHSETTSVAFFGHAGSHLVSIGDPGVDTEHALLSHAASYLADLPTDSILVGWNSAVFDLPFLSARFAVAPRSLRSLAPEVADTGLRSKHGDPIFDGSWQGLSHLDLCLLLREACAEVGWSWALHAVTADLGLAPHTPPGARTFNYSSVRQRAFALSDVRLTYQLGVLVATLTPPGVCDLRRSRLG